MKISLIFALILMPFLGFSSNKQPKLDSIQSLLKNHTDDTSRVYMLLDLSSQLYEMDDYNEAIYRAMQAKELAYDLDFKSGLAASFRRIGTIYTEQGKYPEAIQYLLQSMRIYEATKNQYGVFMTNNSLGTVYYYQEDYKKALAYYLKANGYKTNDATTCSNIGMAYIAQGRYPMSLYFFKIALNNYEQACNNQGIASMLNNIGAVYEGQDKLDSALFYYMKALNKKQELNDNQGICDGLGGIGDIYYKQKKYNESLKYEHASLNLSRKIGYISSVKETEEMLSNIYSKMGDCKRALEHYRAFTVAKDSMFNEENTKKTVTAEKDFEFHKREQDIKMQQAQKDAIQEEKFKSQRFQINVFVCGLVIIAFFSILLFRGYKKIQTARNIITNQKKIVEQKNKEVTDNINYAQRIQLAMLPSEDYINDNFPDNFIMYRPKDIVSGDFYWAYTDGVNKYFATADCTGHGVSGAMMSMIGASLLNEIVIERKITSPELVLNSLREEIIKALNKKGASEERKDGMDISFCKISQDMLQCASANNPVYVIRNKEVIEIKADRFPVGKYINDSPFTLCSQTIEKNDVIITMSDGFSDQFGKLGKKIMSKRFKQWASELSHLNMQEIKKELELRFNSWMDNAEQIDDVTIFAVKV